MFIAFNIAPKNEIVVRSRPDIRLLGELNLTCQPNEIYIPGGNDFRDGINDQFAYGNYEEMKKYFSLYLHWKEYYREGHYLHSEGMLKTHLERMGLTVVRLDWSNEIIR
jgi:hypothetical protein